MPVLLFQASVCYTSTDSFENSNKNLNKKSVLTSEILFSYNNMVIDGLAWLNVHGLTTETWQISKSMFEIICK